MTPTFVDPLIGKRADRYELVHVESGAVLASRLEAALETGARRRGLAGRDAPAPDAALIVAPSRVFHTLGARAAVDVVFVARDGTVLETVRGVKPWRARAAFGAYAVVAAPAGFIERSGTIPGDRLAIREAQAPRPPREIAPQRTGEGGPLVNALDDVETWDLDELAPRIAGARVPGPPDAARSLAQTSAPAAGGRRYAEDAADLERVLARRTPVAWYEAVAVVRELCDAVMAASRGTGQRVPGLAEILLTAEGRVELLGAGPPTPSPAAAAARVLLALLAEAENLPVQVRLLALEEVSPAAGASSMASFAAKLEFFERPGRREHVQRVFERFRGLPPTQMEVLAEAAAQRPAPPPPVPWWRGRRAKAGLAVASAAVVLTVLALEMASVRRGPSGTLERRGPVARAVAGASQRVASIASDGIDAVARWLGLAAPEPPAAAPAAPEAEPVESPAGRAAAATRRARARTPQTAPEPGEAEFRREPAVPALVDTLIYSSEDSGVVPPRLDRSRLPATPRLGAAQRELPQVEVVISAAGEVETVRLVTEPAGVHAAMMLSAVKNWQFQPATRDGVPVRYRMRLRLTNQ